jgi:ABC-type lipoprotein release transport system permease subunit
LVGIGPWYASTYLGTIIVLGSSALIATLLPAVRAATISPVVALHQE